MIRIGVDVGGTKIEALALDETGREVFRKRVATPPGSYEDIVRALVALVQEVDRGCGVRGSLGFGIPGIRSPATGLVKNANLTRLNGHALDDDLERALGRPVRLANDANCFALSEASDGAASAAELGAAEATVFGVILGTGTGGGVVVQGRSLVGPDAIAGEWGHNPLPWPSEDDWPLEPCWCGLSGCIEAYLSGPALGRDYQRRSGTVASGEQVAIRAEAGDPLAHAALVLYCDRLARALASVINLLNPDAIVLGGGVSNVAMLYDRVPQLWQRHVFSDVVTTRLLRARHGAASGVRGAAWLWPAP